MNPLGLPLTLTPALASAVDLRRRGLDGRLLLHRFLFDKLFLVGLVNRLLIGRVLELTFNQALEDQDVAVLLHL
jgi:DNA polymerase III epsilon subunit-like protein